MNIFLAVKLFETILSTQLFTLPLDQSLTSGLLAPYSSYSILLPNMPSLETYFGAHPVNTEFMDGH